MPRFTINHSRIHQRTMTIIDETPTISSTQKSKQVFSPPKQASSEPYVKVPLPILLDIEEFMPKKTGGNKTSNAFIIYRTVFAKVLIKDEYQSKMTDVSKWASISWKNEKAEVKTAYRKFAKEIQLIHKKRSQEALISRNNRRLVAANANVPILETIPSATVPSQMNSQRNESPMYQTNLIIEHENVNIPTFLTHPLSISQHFNSDKDFQENDPLNLTNTFVDGLNQFPVSSSIEDEISLETFNRDFEVSNLALLMHQFQEMYSEVQPFDDEGYGL
jgi:hypothetical protein